VDAPSRAIGSAGSDNPQSDLSPASDLLARLFGPKRGGPRAVQEGQGGAFPARARPGSATATNGGGPVHRSRVAQLSPTDASNPAVTRREMAHSRSGGRLGPVGVLVPPARGSSVSNAPTDSTAASTALQPPDISVIVVSWNTRDELRACLESVLAGLRGICGELIVVDNASADGSAEMVQSSFPEVHLVRSAQNLGFAAGCNIGLQVASGRYLLLLNPDTIVLDDVLSATVRYLDNHPNVGAFGCRVLNPDGTLQPTCFRDPSVLNTFLGLTGLARLRWPRAFGRERMTHWLRDNDRDVDVVTGCYLATRREVVDDVGPLDSGYFFCGEEADWCRRIRIGGWAVRFAPIGDIIHLNGAAGRKLSERRDLLGMAGLVRYVHHHDGWLAGWTMCALLRLHAASRVIAFDVIAVAGRSDEGRRAAKSRRDHYRRVMKGHSEVRALAGLRRPPER
jgi:GT2 family glycosyltransferase